MTWCEEHQGDYVFSLARNTRLETMVADGLAQACAELEQTGQPAHLFHELCYQARDS